MTTLLTLTVHERPASDLIAIEQYDENGMYIGRISDTDYAAEEQRLAGKKVFEFRACDGANERKMRSRIFVESERKAVISEVLLAFAKTATHQLAK